MHNNLRNAGVIISGLCAGIQGNELIAPESQRSKYCSDTGLFLKYA